MLKRKLLLSLSLVSIQGCAILGVGGAYQTMDTVTTGATAVSYGTTGKGLSDHAASAIVGKDCRMFNVFQNKNICRVRKVYEVRNMQEADRQKLQVETVRDTNSLKEKEKLNEYKLGTRHPRHAHKVWRKGSHKKIKR
jgi:alpha-acetolactate decarboxylase